jgi:hypothetical protein
MNKPCWLDNSENCFARDAYISAEPEAILVVGVDLLANDWLKLFSENKNTGDKN